MGRLKLRTAKPVALDSPDHQVPTGTRQDNSFNLVFNRKLEALFQGRTLVVLDLGCSGGGFVKSCLDGGHLAAGLEGSDYSRKLRRAEWATIPDHLFTCDITAPFTLLEEDSGREAHGLAVDVVTAWEVIAHISKADLPRVCENVRRHLSPGGLWIMSVSPNEEVMDGVRLHQTVEDEAWWLAFFKEQGFINHPEWVAFFGKDFVRGPWLKAPGSFHLVLSYGEGGPILPPSPFEVPPEILLKEARRLFALGFVEYASHLLGRLAAGWPDHPGGWNLEARIGMLLGDWVRVGQCLHQGLSVGPTPEQDPGLWGDLGRFLMTHATFPEMANGPGGSEAFRSLLALFIRLFPDQKPYLLALAWSFAKQGHLDGFLSFLFQALPKGPHAQYLKACTMLEFGQWDAALAEADRPLGDIPELHFARAFAHTALGHFDQAWQEANACLQGLPDYAPAMDLVRSLEQRRCQTEGPGPSAHASQWEPIRRPRRWDAPGSLWRGAIPEDPAAAVRVSVITPVLDARETIEDCLESVRAQGYPNLEHIIVDGGSNDGTLDILKTHAGIRWVSEPDLGPGQAMNKAVRMATGQILVRVDADQALVPGAVKRAAELLGDPTEPVIIYGRSLRVQGSDRGISPGVPVVPLTFTRLLRWFESPISRGGVFFTKALIEALGGFNEAKDCPSDLEFWWRAAEAGHASIFLDQPLIIERAADPDAARRGSGGKDPGRYLLFVSPFLQRLSKHERTAFWRAYYLHRLRKAPRSRNGQKDTGRHETALPDPGSLEEYLGRFQAHLALDDTAEAYAINAKLLKAHPFAPEGYWNLAESAFRNGNYTLQREAVQMAMRMEPTDSPALVAGPAGTGTVITRGAWSVGAPESIPDCFPVLTGPLPERRILLAMPYQPFPATTGAGERFKALLECIRLLGYSPLLFGARQLSHMDDDGIRQLQIQWDLPVEMYRPSSGAEQEQQAYGAWEQAVTLGGFPQLPGLTAAFHRCFEKWEPGHIFLSYAYWGPMILAEAFSGTRRIIDTNDLLTVNLAYNRNIRSLLGDPPYDPQGVPDILFDAAFFEQFAPDRLPSIAKELAIYDGFDQAIAISQPECDYLAANLNRANVALLPTPMEPVLLQNAYTAPPVFVGSSGYINVHAYLYFVRRILPLIRRDRPAFLLKVYGSVANLVRSAPGIHLLGPMENLGPIYEQAKYAVCPMVVATGQQIKILHAMAHGLAIVAFRAAGRSSPIQHGVNGFIADTPEAFATYCVRLDKDPALCGRMGAAARETILSECSFDKAAEILEPILNPG
jgi:tetratricopeptide (TPR) repeat protein/glycosyltransferase involved in cell wall biosynthesis